MDRLRLRLELEDLFAAYAACLDDGELERWPEFFTDDCRYEIIPRENFERRLPLAVLRCESKGMLIDRVVRSDGVLKLAERLCVYDSVLVPGSLVYPI